MIRDSGLLFFGATLYVCSSIQSDVLHCLLFKLETYIMCTVHPGEVHIRPYNPAPHIKNVFLQSTTSNGGF